MTLMCEQAFGGVTVEMDSRGKATVNVPWRVFGADDYAVATATLFEMSPLSIAHPTLPLGFLPRSNHSLTQTGEQVWEATVLYSSLDPQQAEEGEFSFDTTGGTTRTIQALAQERYGGDPAPNVGLLIGATKDGVEGVDVTIPAYAWTETWKFDFAQVNTAFRRNIYLLTGATNDAPFRDFATGEVLFFGATGSRRGEKFDVTYKFAASPNVTGLTMGSITGIRKDGWDYLWARFVDEFDSTANVTRKKPVGAYVARVYGRRSFGGLGI